MDKKKLKRELMKSLNVRSEDLIWSSKCNNPSKGFKVGIDNTQEPKAGIGYWVLSPGYCKRLDLNEID